MRSLRHAKGKKYNLGSLLRDCRERRVDDDTLTLMFAHRAHMERMQEEFDDPASRKLVRDAVQSALGGEYEIQVTLADGGGNGPQAERRAEEPLGACRAHDGRPRDSRKGGYPE